MAVDLITCDWATSGLTIGREYRVVDTDYGFITVIGDDGNILKCGTISFDFRTRREIGISNQEVIKTII